MCFHDTLYRSNSVHAHYELEYQSMLNSHCTRNFLYGEDSEGNSYAKAIFCGREWCTICGITNSIPHRRRIVRWHSSYQNWDKVGYFVFTVHRRYHEHMGKEQLRAITTWITRKLKREFGNVPGFARWHFAGDKNPSRYSPHLNILMEWGKLNYGHLKQIKIDYKRFLDKMFGENTGVPNVHYRYKTTESGKGHLLRYVTRSTYQGNNMKVRGIIHKYRNSTRFGKHVKTIPDTKDEATRLLVSNKIKWDKKLISEEKLTAFANQKSCKMVYVGLGIIKLVPNEPDG